MVESNHCHYITVEKHSAIATRVIYRSVQMVENFTIKYELKTFRTILILVLHTVRHQIVRLGTMFI